MSTRLGETDPVGRVWLCHPWGYRHVVLAQAMFHTSGDDIDVLDIVVVEPGGGMLGGEYHPAGAPVSVALRYGSLDHDERLDSALALLDTWSDDLSIVSIDLGDVDGNPYLALSTDGGQELVLQVL